LHLCGLALFSAYSLRDALPISVDEGLGIAEHLVDHEWFAVYGLFGYPADGRGNDWRGPAGPDWVTGPIERQSFLRPSAGYPNKPDRKSTRLNSSHVASSYAVFC